MKRKSKVRPYVKILKEDADWDWSYVLPLLRKKLERMANYFEKSRIAEDWRIMVRDIRLCTKLIDIIDGSDGIYDIHTDTINKYVNIRNAKRFGIREDLLTSEKHSGIFKEELREEKAWHILWRLIELKMQTWWN